MDQNTFFYKDTIAGIATALNEAGIGIIRISGDQSYEVADRIFRPGDKRGKLSDSSANIIHYGFIEENGTTLDEVLVSVMKGPHSFTAEDTVEINCHGGVYAVRRVFDAVIRSGARIAQPGEFTRRAFLNGRIDLSQAEAVMDVIQAKNDLALKSSLSQLQGSVQGKISDIRSKILYELAFIEAALDDPEHYSMDGYPEKLYGETEKWKEQLSRLIASCERGKYIREGIKTVIVGKPNVGKSSLLNCLIGEDRAIVTNMAGTTRDILTESIRLGDATLILTDTAGIHNTEDMVEKIGVERACASAQDADLVLFVLDAAQPFDDDDRKVLDLIRDKNTIILLNKSDLLESSSISYSYKEFPENIPVITISAKERSGLDILEKKITDMFYQGDISFNDEVIITNMRHKQLLLEALQAVGHVQEAIDAMMPEDFLSIDLTEACTALGGITGDEIREDLVNEIFGKFCMGK